MIMVQSTFHLLLEHKQEALGLMKNMVRLCSQEHGCMNYEYFEGITDSKQVILLQEWESAECLQQHYQSDHMENFLGNLAKCLKSPIITRSYVSQDERVVASPINDEAPKPEQTIH